jgi:hypothetical protein
LQHKNKKEALPAGKTDVAETIVIQISRLRFWAPIAGR